MKKIDAHFHLNLKNYGLNDILSYIDSKQLEKIWLLTWEEKAPPIDEIYTHVSIEDLMAAYRQFPDKIVPFYAPDPKSDSIEERLTSLKKQGLKGVGELKVTHLWSEKIIEDYLQIIDKLRLPIIFHMEISREHYVKTSKSKKEKLISDLLNGALNGLTKYYLSGIMKNLPGISKGVHSHLQHFPGYLYDFANLEKRIKQFPEIQFIGHGPHFWNNISNHLTKRHIHQKGKIKQFGIIDALLEQYDNFYCDISGRSGYNALSRDPGQAKYFIEKHSDKILFGTDNTTFDFDNLLVSLNINKQSLENIYYNNSEKILSN